MIEVVKPAAQRHDGAVVDRLLAAVDRDGQWCFFWASAECAGKAEVTRVGAHRAERLNADRVEPRGEKLEQRAIGQVA